MIKKLQTLINKWEKEAEYLNNPLDDERDQCVGRTYLECAEQLKKVLVSQKSLYKMYKVMMGEKYEDPPVVQANAEKPACCKDMKPDPFGYDCVCPICGRIT